MQISTFYGSVMVSMFAVLNRNEFVLKRCATGPSTPNSYIIVSLNKQPHCSKIVLGALKISLFGHGEM